MWKVIAFALVALFCAVSSEARCIGTPLDPDRQPGCRKLKSKSACLAAKAYIQNDDYATSCRWRVLNKKDIREEVYQYTKFNSIGTTFNYRGSLTGTEVKVTMPVAGKNRFQTSNLLYSGRQTPPYSSYHICPAGLEKPLSCTSKFVPPTGYAKTEPYKENLHLLILYMNDPAYIEQMRSNVNGSLDKYIKLKLDYTFFRGPPFVPAARPNPIIQSETALGVSVNYTGFYQISSYRAYDLSNVTGADWSVQALYQLKGLAWNDPTAPEATQSSTRLTVMIIPKDAFDKWAEKCTKICAPPVKQAIKGTVCVGLSCKGKVRGLNPKQKYKIFAGYPKIYSYAYQGPWLVGGPVEFPYPSQRIKIDVLQRDYKLGPKAPEVKDGALEIFENDLEIVKPYRRATAFEIAQ